VIKLGITTLARLQTPRTWLGREKHASLLLLADPALQSPGKAGCHERIVKRVLFGDGTWRETAVGRFRVLDRLTVNLLQERHPPRALLRVFDVAASTGCTSVELYRALCEQFRVDFVASDRTRDAFAVRARGSRLTTIVDARCGDVLQYVSGPFVLPGQGRESALYPVNRLARLLCARARSPRLRAIVSSTPAREGEPLVWVSVDDHEVMKLPLLSRECIALLKHDPHFRYELADILQPLQGTADVIRAMNILHDQYFCPDYIRTALRNCLDALAEDGMLIVGRSPTDDPAAVTATIFAKQPSGIDAIARLNGGSEIESLVHESLA
jgi:hypothetical protein